MSNIIRKNTGWGNINNGIYQFLYVKQNHERNINLYYFKEYIESLFDQEIFMIIVMIFLVRPSRGLATFKRYKHTDKQGKEMHKI